MHKTYGTIKGKFFAVLDVYALEEGGVVADVRSVSVLTCGGAVKDFVSDEIAEDIAYRLRCTLARSPMDARHDGAVVRVRGTYERVTIFDSYSLEYDSRTRLTIKRADISRAKINRKNRKMAAMREKKLIAAASKQG